MRKHRFIPVVIAAVIAPSDGALAQGLTFAPPSAADALEAYQNEVVLRETGIEGAVAPLALQTAAYYPWDLQLNKCVGPDSRRASSTVGFDPVASGWNCEITVFPFTDPPFGANGVFYLDGGRWRFSGAAGFQIDHNYEPENRGELRPKFDPRLDPFGLRPGASPYMEDSEDQSVFDEIDPRRSR